MALKILLRKNSLEQIEAKRAALDSKFEELAKREEDLEAAIEEINEETTDEERKVVEGKVDELEAEKEELEKQKDELEAKIEELKAEIAELEEPEDEDEPAAEPVEEPRSQNLRNTINRGVDMKIERRQAIQELIKRQEVKNFLSDARKLMQGRAVENPQVVIPTNVIDFVREEIAQYSKLINLVDLRKVKGKAREVIIGEYPEGIWIETCTNLNELTINLYDVEIDGYTVGGYIPLCRAALIDSDFDLAMEIITSLGQAIGKGTDKAITYGTGIKMPLGIVTRLAQTAKPESWRTTSIPWVNLATTNVQAITGTGTTLFKNIIKALILKKDSKGGQKVWIMNENTKNALLAEAITFNAAGAIVAGVNGTFPVVGGQIVELDFIPDGDVIVGYAKQYLLVEREGILIEHSDDVMFYNHKRVYKGLARYDGTPLFGEGFMLFNINGAAPTTTVAFPEDKANAVEAPATGE